MTERQIDWKKEFKTLFPKETMDYQVETPFFKGRYVNLDNAATTSAFKGVEDIIKSTLNSYGSVHRGSGQKSKISTDLYEQARETIRKFVGASKDNYVIFVNNTTEAINHAAYFWSKVPGKILVSDIEHSSNLLSWMKSNDIVQYKTSRNGIINPKDVEIALKQNRNIKLVAITGCSNVTGYKPNIYEIAKIAHKYGAKILVDVCQLIQHQKVDVLNDGDPRHLDFIAFSGHKMYAPFGTGVLIGPKYFFDSFEPYQIGGGNFSYITKNLKIKYFKTEMAHDPGTPNAIGAIAIAEAIKIICALGYNKISEYESGIVTKTYAELKKIKEVKLYIPKSILGSVITFDLKGFNHYLVAEILANEYGTGVRAGSFCTYELIRKLKNIFSMEDKKIESEIDTEITKNIPGVVRASFSIFNSLEDVDRFVKAIQEIVKTRPKEYEKKYIRDEKTGRYSLNG